MKKVLEKMCAKLADMVFEPPVAYVYNPLYYAGKSHDIYCRRFGSPPKKTVLVGMNPGPWGMAQTGVPFGEVEAVRDWLGIRTDIDPPVSFHPKRPVQGFDCPRSEVSGRRLWGWAAGRFGVPENFFTEFFVINYCPLMFLEESGRNRTPDKLPRKEKERLFAVCDEALYGCMEYLAPDFVVGVGKFAETRASAALKGLDVRIGGITHPSPANPAANRGWAGLIETQLAKMGCI